MIRLFGLSLVLAAAAMTPASSQPQPPSNQLMERAGWTFIALSDDTLVYMKDAAQPSGATRQVWTAYETLKPRDREGFAFRSVESLGEYDCGEGRTRVLRETFYDGPSLAGRTWQAPDFEVTEWAQPGTGSIGELRIAFACRERPLV